MGCALRAKSAIYDCLFAYVIMILYRATLFIVVITTDERCTPQDGHSTGISRTGPSEVLVRGGEDGVDQVLALDYDRGSSGKSTSSNSRAGTAGDLAFSSVVRPAPGDCRRPDADASERSISVSYTHLTLPTIYSV